MSLLPLDAFADVFQPLQKRRIGYVRPVGNVGDRLIEQATEQLFADFGIQWVDWSPDRLQDIDEIVYGGGGNMGPFYSQNYDLRTRCLETGLPVTILPQSFMSVESRPFRRVFVRERTSLQIRPDAILTPDLALGLRVQRPAPPVREVGIFLRRDYEQKMRRRWFCRDPVRVCETPQQYLSLAARHARIITDRLHFAIAGLLMGRETTLLPNSYHKNRSMHDTWLSDLGCRFAEDVAQALADGKLSQAARRAG
jgi:exopolysaccharide biosynthesis predicted pyruvyltransferase EpsI